MFVRVLRMAICCFSVPASYSPAPVTVPPPAGDATSPRVYLVTTSSELPPHRVSVPVDGPPDLGDT